jgi:predicted glycosyltransferase
MKKVLIDIYHLPQFNFFKNAILTFDPEEVDIYCVNRGKLLNVIQHELPDYNITCIGDYKHNKGMYSMIFKIIIPRIFRLYKEINSSKYKFILTANYQANFIGKLKGIPNVAFNDDPRKFVFPFLKFSADEVYLPPFGSHYKGVKFFNALKEWSYLSPKYFSPDISALKEYGLESKNYIFIREVSTKTSNYLDQDKDIILSVADRFPKDWQVVLSLENKESTTLYPKNWIILKEPVTNIHSLMYYSTVVVSSGDSMAREGAMLGVPSIYAGIRDMPANEILIKKDMLLKLNPEEIVPVISDIIQGERVFDEQDEFRKKLFNEWDDITRLILNKSEQTLN